MVQPQEAASPAEGAAGNHFAERGSLDGLVASDSVRRLCAEPSHEQQQLVEALERHYAAELRRMSPSWVCFPDGPTQPPVDVAKTVGVPPTVLGAILAGKCRDQRIPVTLERQKKFVECLLSNCASEWFVLRDCGVGPECAKGVVLALALNDRFTALDLACNALGDVGVEALTRLLLEHRTLAHVDLAANNISSVGVGMLLDTLLANRSVTHLDLSARAGRSRNRLARNNANTLEVLLLRNPVLSKLNLAGTAVGVEGATSLARGLMSNTTLISLDLAANDLGPKGACALAEALGCCALEELNLTDNHIGDEGLVAIASKLGVLPSSDIIERAAASASIKYHEALVEMKHNVSELSPGTFAIADEAERLAAHARVTGSIQQLAAVLLMSTSSFPRLKALQLSNNNASVASISRVEDVLQVNNVIERLSLDQCDHRGTERGATSLTIALSLNASLRSLSLGYSRLGKSGIVDVAKALAFNQGLESLSLRGNKFGEEAASALGAVLGTGAKGLKQLHLGSCHLDDAAGVAIAGGLATNTALEVLNLRDNCLGEATGRAFNSSLQGQTTLLQLSLELNGIDLRWLGQIKKLLDRNLRLRGKARPHKYRVRIDELVKCQEEVVALSETIKRNEKLKSEMCTRQEALLKELDDTRLEAERHTEEMERRLAEVAQERKQVDEEIATVMAKLRQVTSEGEYVAGQQRLRINNVEERLRQYEKSMSSARKQLEQFEEDSHKELAGLQEELEKAEKAHSSAELLAAATQRNLDNFSSSLKAIKEDLPGGDNPRQQLGKSGEVARPGSRGTSRNRGLNRMLLQQSPGPHTEAVQATASTPRRPVTPMRPVKASASPRTQSR